MAFAFDKGDCVNHRCGSLASIVIDRELTATGREQYRIARTAKSAVARRTILGEALVKMNPGSKDCDGCIVKCCPEMKKPAV